MPGFEPMPSSVAYCDVSMPASAPGYKMVSHTWNGFVMLSTVGVIALK